MNGFALTGRCGIFVLDTQGVAAETAGANKHIVPLSTEPFEFTTEPFEFSEGNSIGTTSDSIILEADSTATLSDCTATTFDAAATVSGCTAIGFDSTATLFPISLPVVFIFDIEKVHIAPFLVIFRQIRCK